jgi:hypothetical protein
MEVRKALAYNTAILITSVKSTKVQGRLGVVDGAVEKHISLLRNYDFKKLYCLSKGNGSLQ